MSRSPRPSLGEQSPGPTIEQRLHALRQANEIRLARGRLRAAIARGEIFAASVLLEAPPEARSWEVGKLLGAQPRWGSRRVHRFLARNYVSEMRPVGALTERQRKLLAGQLQGTASPGRRGASGRV